MGKRGAYRRRGTVRASWEQVRVALQCSRGHQIERGAWVRFSQAGYQQTVTCEACVWKFYGLRRPNSSFGFQGDAEDVKARQAGGDE